MIAVAKPPKTAGTKLQASEKPKVRTSAGMISEGKSTMAPSLPVERTDSPNCNVNHRKKEGAPTSPNGILGQCNKPGIFRPYSAAVASSATGTLCLFN